MVYYDKLAHNKFNLCQNKLFFAWDFNKILKNIELQQKVDIIQRLIMVIIKKINKI